MKINRQSAQEITVMILNCMMSAGTSNEFNVIDNIINIEFSVKDDELFIKKDDNTKLDARIIKLIT